METKNTIQKVGEVAKKGLIAMMIGAAIATTTSCQNKINQNMIKSFSIDETDFNYDLETHNGITHITYVKCDNYFIIYTNLKGKKKIHQINGLVLEEQNSISRVVAYSTCGEKFYFPVKEVLNADGTTSYVIDENTLTKQKLVTADVIKARNIDCDTCKERLESQLEKEQ